MAYKLQDYRKIGLRWYPIKIYPTIISGGRSRERNTITIEVIDEPKDEREMLQMIIEEQNKQVEYWERNGMI